MKKRNINKIISLTLCLSIAFSVVVGAKTTNKSSKATYSYCNSFDPHPSEPEAASIRK